MTDLVDEIADLKAPRRRHDPRPLLPGRRDPGPGRLHRRQPEAGPRRHDGDDADDRLLRRPLHGRDGQDAQPRQAGAPARPAGRLQPGRELPRPTSWPAIRRCSATNGRRFQTVTYINSIGRGEGAVRLGRHLAATPRRSSAACPRTTRSCSSPTGTWASTSQEVTGRPMILWNGSCMVHEIFSVGDLLRLKRRLPAALTIAHPECPANIREQSDFVGGTEAMIRYVAGFSRADRLPRRHRGEHALAVADARCRGTATTRCRASPAPATSARTWPATRWKSSRLPGERGARDHLAARVREEHEVLQRSLLN